MSAHATLSPSSAPRWLRCPGSVSFIKGFRDEGSIYSREGTAAHEVSDDCLTLGMDVEDFLGREIVVGSRSIEMPDGEIALLPGDTFTVTREWVDYLQPGIDRTRELGGTFYGEHKVDLSEWLGPDQFGTLDRGIWRKDLIVVSDLKFGAGVPVYPERNEQLMLYALAFWWNVARHHTKTRKVLIIIDQPRADGGGGEWYTTVDELLEFAEEARKGAARTREPNAPRVAGEKQCQWCPARVACPEYAAYNLAIMCLKFDDFDDADDLGLPVATPSVESLTPTQKSQIARHKATLLKFIDLIHTDVLNSALAGFPTPGLKATRGRNLPRKWTDEARAERFLTKKLAADEVFTKKLLTPSQAEELLGKKYNAKLEMLTTRPEPKPVLVPEDSPRERIISTAAKFDLFDDEEFDD